jgi:hypothetical protein
VTDGILSANVCLRRERNRSLEWIPRFPSESGTFRPRLGLGRAGLCSTAKAGEPESCPTSATKSPAPRLERDAKKIVTSRSQATRLEHEQAGSNFSSHEQLLILGGSVAAGRSGGVSISTALSLRGIFVFSVLDLVR